VCLRVCVHVDISVCVVVDVGVAVLAFHVTACVGVNERCGCGLGCCTTILLPI